jgi:hypothetical protein
MSPVNAAATALYDARGKALTADAPPYDGDGGMMHVRDVVDVIYDSESRDFDGAVDLIWVLPAGDDPLPIPQAIFGQVVSVLDENGAVAVHATSRDAIFAAVENVTAFLGGGRA